MVLSIPISENLNVGQFILCLWKYRIFKSVVSYMPKICIVIKFYGSWQVLDCFFNENDLLSGIGLSSQLYEKKFVLMLDE